jgi:hypothetical protein
MKIKYITLVFLIFALQSCVSVTRYSREEVNPPLIFVGREDFEITEDLTASANVKISSFLFINSMKYDDKKQLRVGPFIFGDRDYNMGSFDGYPKPKEFDEQIATFNFISQNNNIDYVTNIKFKKSYSHHPYIKGLNIGKREMETTIIAKGIILKNKGKVQN